MRGSVFGILGSGLLMVCAPGCTDLCEGETDLVAGKYLGASVDDPEIVEYSVDVTAELDGERLEISQIEDGAQWLVVFEVQNSISDDRYQTEGHDSRSYCGPGPGTATLVEVSGGGAPEDSDLLTLYWERFVAICPHAEDAGFDLVDELSCHPEYGLRDRFRVEFSDGS